MIRRFVIAFIVMISLPVLAAKNLLELPSDMAGSMMPYDFSYTQSEPIWPDSLKPVYVARVARHGARYISSPKKLDKLKDAISKASVAGTLTKDGKKFDTLIKTVEEVTGNQWGRLSEVGCEEEVRLAEDLYRLLPDLLRKAHVNSISTYVPRVVMTMYQFNHELTALSGDINITASEGKHYNYLLRCFTADSIYSSYRDNGSWKKVSEKLMDSIVSPEPARRILGKIPGFDDYKLRKITLEMYDVLQSLTAFGMPAPTDEFMSVADYHACWEVDNLEHYLRNTDTPISSLAGKASSPLLARIIADADASLNAKLIDLTMKRANMIQGEAPERFDANFYFGHAETLMPLLSLMRVPGCYDDSGDFTTLSSRWKNYEIVPLGANIDIIFLQSSSQHTYITMRHNGRFLPPMSGTMIVPWPEYKAYLISLMIEVASK
ncbi:MAG: histidine phosphatase family protein, partial [Muribaculaceae bacterium]|nr:histidine phosphatase family protein [Muribaculaceae bacterium]